MSDEERWVVAGGPWTFAEWREIDAGGELSPSTYEAVYDHYRRVIGDWAKRGAHGPIPI